MVIPEVEARHFAYFLILPMAASALYSLGLRIARPWAAFSAALLFLAQPLIFVHAYSPDYIMVLTRSNADQRLMIGGPPVVQVTVAGATLAEVRPIEAAP